MWITCGSDAEVYLEVIPEELEHLMWTKEYRKLNIEGWYNIRGNAIYLEFIKTK